MQNVVQLQNTDNYLFKGFREVLELVFEPASGSWTLNDTMVQTKRYWS